MTYTYQNANQRISRDCARWLAYAVFLNIDLGEGGSIDCVYGPDSLGLVPPLHPYPISGVNVGQLTIPLLTDPGSKLEDGLPVAGTGLSRAQDARLVGYKRIVTFGAYSSARKEVEDIILDPGPRSSTRSSSKGEPNPNRSGNLLVCLVNLASGKAFPNQFKFILNSDPVYQPPKEKYDGQYTINEFEAHCYASTDSLGLPTGDIWTRYWVTNNGLEVDWSDPSNPVPIDPNASNRAYPALNMAGMLG